MNYTTCQDWNPNLHGSIHKVVQQVHTADRLTKWVPFEQWQDHAQELLLFVLKTTDATNAVLCYLIGSTTKVGKESDSLNHSPLMENERRKLLAWQSPRIFWKILHIYLALLGHKSGNRSSQPGSKPILHIHNIQTTISSAMACMRRHSWEAILTETDLQILVVAVVAHSTGTTDPFPHLHPRFDGLPHTCLLFLSNTPQASSFPLAFSPTNSAQRPQQH
jgi:hypothetical protein